MVCLSEEDTSMAKTTTRMRKSLCVGQDQGPEFEMERNTCMCVCVVIESAFGWR